MATATPTSERDIRELIAYTLEDIGVTPTPQNVGKIYTLVIHIAANNRVDRIENAIRKAIREVTQKGE